MMKENKGFSYDITGFDQSLSIFQYNIIERASSIPHLNSFEARYFDHTLLPLNLYNKISFRLSAYVLQYVYFTSNNN